MEDPPEQKCSIAVIIEEPKALQGFVPRACLDLSWQLCWSFSLRLSQQLPREKGMAMAFAQFGVRYKSFLKEQEVLTEHRVLSSGWPQGIPC